MSDGAAEGDGVSEQDPRLVEVCWAGGTSSLGDVILHRTDKEKSCGNQPTPNPITDLTTAAVINGNELCSACEWPEGSEAVLADEYLATDGGQADGEIDHEDCARCSGRIDPTEPGHYKSADEVFVHSVCYEEGEPSTVLDLTEEHPFMEQYPIQYGCGHFAHGPPIKLPSECPDCEVPAP